MRDLVHRYIDRQVSRRAFARGMTAWGFSLAAVASILDSLDPIVAAAEPSATGGGAGSTWFRRYSGVAERTRTA